MRLTLLILALPFCLAPTAPSALTLEPTVISGWSGPSSRIPSNPPSGDNLSTLDGGRAALVYDLSGINPAQIDTMSLRMIPIRDGDASIRIEAIGLASGAALDPFIWTLHEWASPLPTSSYEAEAGPCYTDPASCPALPVYWMPGEQVFGMQKQTFQYPYFDLEVTDAASALSAGSFLQLSILPSSGSGGVGSGNQFGRPDWPGSPYPDGGAVLNVTLIPEPSTALLLGVGLAGIARRRF